MRRSKPSSPEELRARLVALLADFEKKLGQSDLRPQVRALVPAFHTLRDLGASLIPSEEAESARDRIRAYFQRYPTTIIDGDELLVVSGIQEYARRIRELRVQQGWQIFSGVTFKQLVEGDEEEAHGLEELLQVAPANIKPDQYVLMKVENDRDAAHRWFAANTIRKKSISTQKKLLEFLQANVGKQVSGEELAYLSSPSKEWARRIRELRTEQGWAISTKMSGRPDLPVGVYVLEHDRQAPEHDRKIEDAVRVAVLKRDHFSCIYCGWKYSDLSPGDPRRFLELHHIREHASKGANTEDNLVTLCNVHHDVIHSSKSSEHEKVTTRVSSYLA